VRIILKGHLGRPVLVAAAVLLGALGLTFLVIGLRPPQHAPQPPASAAGTYAASAPASRTPSDGTPSASVGVTPRGPILPRSTPTHLSIPAIGVSSRLLSLGLNSDHTVQVPPLDDVAKAGWYRYSPSPGQLGPSILLGHIDSAKSGPGVFFKLGGLRKGNMVSIRRADNTVAVFRVDAVAEYAKKRFPANTVYGDTDNAALRLITCGGRFNSSAHSYVDNIVAYASLVSSHRE
jgi:Sortase domain